MKAKAENNKRDVKMYMNTVKFFEKKQGNFELITKMKQQWVYISRFWNKYKLGKNKRRKNQ